jgi:hypothetical protein
MKIGTLTIEFLFVFIVTFAVSSLVTFLYSLLVHSNGIFDWETALRLSITLGIIFTWLKFRNKK